MRMPVVLAITTVAVILSGCSGGSVFNVNSGTAAEYQIVVDESETLLDEAKAMIPADSIEREDERVTNLETDQHRLRCSDTTSQYSNRINLWLVDGTNEIALIDSMRDDYLDRGFQRADTLKDDPTAGYQQILRSSEGYGLTISRGNDTDGTTILQLQVYSPCVANPADKPTTWGLF